jgi:alanine-glyoxylate transaminase/(R)-3-amino-2-methylpropionate-pyruvate transaminase
MIGVEMVENSHSRKAMNANSFVDIWERCKDLGVLLGKGGINGNVRNYYYYLQTNKQTNE